MNPLRRSLRRWVTFAVAATFIFGFVFGYVVLTFGHDIIVRLWGSYTTYTSGHPYLCIPHGIRERCYPPLSAGAHVWSVVIALVVLGLLAWGWWALAGRALRPLSQLARTVRQLGPQNLGQRIRMAGATDSLKELADALDEVLDRLAAGYDSQRRFASNASHELRTPLAVQRLLTEVALDDPGTGDELRRLGAQLLRTNERSERLIEGLLVLAESDRGLQGKVPVRLDELTGSILDTHRELADKHGVSLHRRLAERLVPGDPVLLEQLVSNLVTNAITYNEPGGWVEIEVVTSTEPGPALAVRNTGQSVPAEAVSLLFEPFRRLTADRINHSGGTGLGMSIVRSITTAHGGTVRARPRHEGGLIVEIDLPAKP
jgi:signal transduction histidine kinase